MSQAVYIFPAIIYISHITFPSLYLSHSPSRSVLSLTLDSSLSLPLSPAPSSFSSSLLPHTVVLTYYCPGVIICWNLLHLSCILSVVKLSVGWAKSGKCDCVILCAGDTPVSSSGLFWLQISPEPQRTGSGRSVVHASEGFYEEFVVSGCKWKDPRRQKEET